MISAAWRCSAKLCRISMCAGGPRGARKRPGALAAVQACSCGNWLHFLQRADMLRSTHGPCAPLCETLQKIRGSRQVWRADMVAPRTSFS